MSSFEILTHAEFGNVKLYADENNWDIMLSLSNPVRIITMWTKSPESLESMVHRLEAKEDSLFGLLTSYATSKHEAMIDEEMGVNIPGWDDEPFSDYTAAERAVQLEAEILSRYPELRNIDCIG